MDSRPRATTAERVYEDVEPSMEWARETAADTLLIYLHGVFLISTFSSFN